MRLYSLQRTAILRYKFPYLLILAKSRHKIMMLLVGSFIFQTLVQSKSKHVKCNDCEKGHLNLYEHNLKLKTCKRQKFHCTQSDAYLHTQIDVQVIVLNLSREIWDFVYIMENFLTLLTLIPTLWVQYRS